jgi:endonuclease/exonuclease/phosphatase family metal-dependent hydrolase
MRVCTFNIHGGTDIARRPSLPAVADLLAATDADVVLLQECDRFLPRSGFKDQALWLSRRLGYQVCHFHGRLGAGPVRFGNAVLTRRVVARRLTVDLPGGGEPRAAAGVVLSGGATVFSVHLGLRDEWRSSQLEALVAAVNGLPGDAPVVVGGDFNAGPDAIEIATFVRRAGLTDLCGAAPEATFPADDPKHRIDFLFGRGLAASAAGVRADPTASDHGLVWADLEVVSYPASDSSAVAERPSNVASSPSNSSDE